MGCGYREWEVEICKLEMYTRELEIGRAEEKWRNGSWVAKSKVITDNLTRLSFIYTTNIEINIVIFSIYIYSIFLQKLHNNVC